MSGAGRKGAGPDDVRRVMEDGEEYVIAGRRIRDQETAETYALLLLAFLDAMGYAQRSPQSRGQVSHSSKARPDLDVPHGQTAPHRGR
jgi:hypothetical protein